MHWLVSKPYYAFVQAVRLLSWITLSLVKVLLAILNLGVSEILILLLPH